MENFYYLPANKSEASPGNIIFFDTESWYDPDRAYETGQYHRLRLGVAIAGRLEKGKWTREKTCHFKTAQEFWDFVASRSHSKIPLWLFAHNVGYDLMTVGFPERLWDGTFYIFPTPDQKIARAAKGYQTEERPGFICTDNPPVIINVTNQEGWKLWIVDTFNFWTTSLSKIGDMVGVEKMDMPILTAPDDEWFTYCQRDVEVLKTAVLGLISWVKDNKLGKFRYTAPSMAMAAYRHRFNSKKIVCHDNLTVRTFEREGYYGGRLECFYLGEVGERVYELDVSSLYPSVMHGNLYPKKVEKWYHPNTHSVDKGCKFGLDTMACVKLKTQDGYPKRIPSMGTIYPVGEYWTTLAGPELVRADQEGVITDCCRWIKFELAEIFTDFVDFFWEYRKEQKNSGNKLNADLAKLLMNGLYGKFGQKTNGWTDEPDISASGKFGTYAEIHHASNSTELYREIGQCVQRWTGKQEHPFAFPAIAAFVTSYARERMRSLRELAGRSEVFYLVTDAIFTTETGRERLELAEQLSETELGLLRIKHAAESAKFEALHHYTIGDHSCEGSKKKSARPQGDGSFIELQFESLDKCLKRKPDGSVHVKPITKRYSKDYKRGTILDSGWVKPLLLME